ncbi:transaldolase [Fusarium tjaetaba]|uniref:Transaldolase n=1 Tax=Fusarium tjaetaba TaxID=1567544 RepID=A0A8H5S0U3_9HYPO|nr:transaldolase [Fusarium tjaetaba]KAF5643407.1 transaldolase [Fusarium tjaetaba]
MAPQTENSFLHEIEQKTIQDPSNAEVIKVTAFELQDQGFLAILSRIAVHLCKRNIDLIKGRVLVQTSPSAAYKLQETLDHARLYASEFERAGIPKNRYCIKIMATGPGLNAAKILQEEGISTLGTGVFSVVQAVACSQAGCLYISPYYNEIRTHLNPELWPDVQDPALEHPFSHRIAQMVQAYKTLFATTGKEQPLIKNAGFRSYKEVLALAELGCHSATISQDLMEEFKTLTPGGIPLPVAPKVAAMKSPYAGGVPIPSPRLDELLTQDLAEERGWSAKELTVDLLADGGKALDQALERDSEAARMVKEALDMFIYCEEETKKLIKGTALVASL